MGGAPDIRNRPQEFIIGEKLTKSQMQPQMNEMLAQVIATFSDFDPGKLLEIITVQSKEPTILSAIYRIITHLDHHVGQVVYITKLKLGKAYQLKYVY